jgi:hypothetical protein
VPVDDSIPIYSHSNLNFGKDFFEQIIPQGGYIEGTDTKGIKDEKKSKPHGQSDRVEAN